MLSLPRENVPANFNWAVGNYTLSVTAGPTNVAAGSPITVRIRLQGKGALDALALPAQPGWEMFKPLSPTAKLGANRCPGLEGAKTFEEVAFPESAEVKSLPPISFNSLPGTEKYQVITQPGLPLTVTPTAAAPPRRRLPPAGATTGKRLPLRISSLSNRGWKRWRWWGRPWFSGRGSSPCKVSPSCFGLACWHGANGSSSWPPTRGCVVGAGWRTWSAMAWPLCDAAGSARAGSRGILRDAFPIIARAIRRTAGFACFLDHGGDRRGNVSRPRGVPDSTLTRLHELFQACNLARYAPVKSSQELESLIPEAEALLAEVKHLEP